MRTISYNHIQRARVAVSWLVIAVVTLTTVVSPVAEAFDATNLFNTKTNRYRGTNNGLYTGKSACSAADYLDTPASGGGGGATGAGGTTAAGGTTTPSGGGNDPALTAAGYVAMGATYYGGNYSSGGWSRNTADDNGIGASGDSLLGKTDGYAELSNDNGQFRAIADMLNLPAGMKLDSYKGLPFYTKLAVVLPGGDPNKPYIIQKYDRGAGGPATDGVPRAIDLWYETAAAMGLKGENPILYVKLAAADATTNAVATSATTSVSPPCAAPALAQTSAGTPTANCSATAPSPSAPGSAAISSFFGAMNDTSNLVNMDFMGKNAQVNKKVVGCLQAVIDEIKAGPDAGYQLRQFGCFRNDSNPGFFHGYGAACDINPDTNGCVGGSCGGGVGGVGQTDIPRSWIDAFNHHGWGWGGDWRSMKDYMHFEYTALK